MTAPQHDPERCATCSGKRHRYEPRRLYEALAEYLETVLRRREAP